MEINDSNYDELLAQGKPMVIDFWATWCGPCRKVGPTIQELADQYEGQAIIGKVNIEEDADDLVSEFGIRNIPTILFIKGGEVVDKVVGAAPKSTLEEKLKAIL
ncbi:MAG: thioredoxin [Bacteroidaceae bacterium]|mgnify:FL=1|nr:thioredoxin [Bacteroidaceae bacterium]